MRPSDITDGMPSLENVMALSYCCFNEAVGYHRRNVALLNDLPSSYFCFNEAVGYHRRNVMTGTGGDYRYMQASMRPSDITDGMLVEVLYRD